jgi:hypothetical protein
MRVTASVVTSYKQREPRPRRAEIAWMLRLMALSLIWAVVPTVVGEPAKNTLPVESAVSVLNSSISSETVGTYSAGDEIPKAASDTVYNFYLGNLHSHTSYTDGKSTPAHAFEYARDTSGIDFLAITDHHGGLSDSEYADVLFQAGAYTDDGIFVAIAGQEWTSGLRSHCNVFEADHVFTAPEGDFDSLYSELYLSGCTASFDHPSPGCFFNYAHSPTGDAGINAVEVRNDKEQGMYIKILNKGWHVGTDGSQDNHEANWGDGPWWTVALAGSLTKADILGAHRSHRTYSTFDRNLQLTFQAEGHWMGEMFSHLDTVSFAIDVNDPDVGDHIELIELYQNGLPINWITIDTNFYSWHPDIIPPNGINYYFVKVHKTDGKRAWSSPIWIDCTTDLPSTPILSSPTNGGTLVTPTPAFSWHPSDNAEAYTLQYSTSDSFPDNPSTVAISDITDTSCTLMNSLQDETGYFWRVASSGDSGISTYSGIRGFFIDLDALFLSDSEIRLTTHPLDDMYPSIHRTSAETWLIWSSDRMANEELYYKTSSDNGESWSDEVRLTYDEADDACPAMVEDLNGKIWVTWDSFRDDNYEVYCKTYDGMSWSEETNLTQHPGADLCPSIAQTSDSLIWLMWTSDRADSNNEIYYSTFDGHSWSPETRLTYSETQDFCPEIVKLENGELWAIWHTWEHGCYYKIFDGISWSDDISLLDSTAHYPSVAQTSNGQIVLAYVKEKWMDPVRFPWSGGLFYKTYQDSIWSDEAKLSDTFCSSNRWSSVTQTSDGRIWVAYQTVRDGNEDIYAQPSHYSTPPEAIDDLSAALEDGAKSTSGDIRLRWTEPYDDVGVIRYVVRRSTEISSLGDSLAGTTDTTYLDLGAAGTIGTDYFYAVEAVDGSGQKSEDSNRAGEFDIWLPRGKK